MKQLRNKGNVSARCDQSVGQKMTDDKQPPIGSPNRTENIGRQQVAARGLSYCRDKASVNDSGQQQVAAHAVFPDTIDQKENHSR